MHRITQTVTVTVTVTVTQGCHPRDKTDIEPSTPCRTQTRSPSTAISSITDRQFEFGKLHFLQLIPASVLYIPPRLSTRFTQARLPPVGFEMAGCSQFVSSLDLPTRHRLLQPLPSALNGMAAFKPMVCRCNTRPNSYTQVSGQVSKY